MIIEVGCGDVGVVWGVVLIMLLNWMVFNFFLCSVLDEVFFKFGMCVVGVLLLCGV